MGKTITTVLLLAALPQGLQTQHSPPVVRAELLADTLSLRPGERAGRRVAAYSAGLAHLLDKSGRGRCATTVQMTWPAKFVGSDVQYPVPVRVAQPGDITAYGYSESVLLPAAVEVPKDARIGSTAEFAAEVSWLCCKDVCVPGKADLTLRLPVAPASQPVNMELFREWAQQVPVAWNSTESPAQKREGEWCIAEKGDGAVCD